MLGPLKESLDLEREFERLIDMWLACFIISLQNTGVWLTDLNYNDTVV